MSERKNYARAERSAAVDHVLPPDLSEGAKPLITNFKLSGRQILEADEFTFPFFEQCDAVVIHNRSFRCRHPATDRHLEAVLLGSTDSVIVLPGDEPSSKVTLKLKRLWVSSPLVWLVQARRGVERMGVSVHIATGYGLSKSESRVLELVIEDMKFEAIAERLCISTETVKSHMKQIYAKTNVTGRAGLLSLIIKHVV